MGQRQESQRVTILYVRAAAEGTAPARVRRAAKGDKVDTPTARGDRGKAPGSVSVEESGKSLMRLELTYLV